MRKIYARLNFIRGIYTAFLAFAVVAAFLGYGSSAAAFAAVFAGLVAIDQTLRIEAAKESEFSLQSYLGLVEKGVQMFVDDPIERSNWILVARTLEGARRFTRRQPSSLINQDREILSI